MEPGLPGNGIAVFRQIFGEELGIPAHIVSDTNDFYPEADIKWYPV